MSNFRINIQSVGSYNFAAPEEKSIPVQIHWEGGKIRAHLSPDEYDVEGLLDIEWPELAQMVAERVARYLLHSDKESAKALLEWLADDPEDEKRCMIEEAEQEYRIPLAITAVRSALRMLGTEARARVLAEVE